ncbi:MAG TPA: threonine-phosphate decarboxylase CobD [Bacillota bacterium]|nr:threonine-phosphate decarboxylase CobD [Peptococcaceae bacterium MAG4]NLW39133.1 threonine-phosphate decarboxylase [Peptococcaceae bacterium]HPU35942.1 threonine-phosphate decarboxylase CobD [Bacillota bacterium]HPZ42423.1 threonine-phosphate decarboxylase CobD [Bacillota bacterium]HQD75089.1 threonine-phosphate decarboxylase CobD [Bacillota bacterium]
MRHLEHIHGGNVNLASRRYNIPVHELLDFSANINPLGPSPKSVSAVIDNLGLISSYPDPDCTELKSVLASHLGIREELLLMGNGAVELIYLLVRVLEARKALIPVPTFSEYGLAMLSQGGEVLEIALDEKKGFRLPLDDLIRSLDQVDLIFLCNPNNPTGRLLDSKTIEYILDKSFSHGAMLLVDEAFMDFIPEKKRFSVMNRVGEFPNLAVLYSLTKFFGIPGLRLGAIAAPEIIINRMKTAKDPWNVNVLAQVAGVAGLRDQDYMERTVKLVRQEKQFLFRELKRLPGLKPLPGAANFFLVEVTESGLTSDKLTELLGRRGIMVRDCNGFAGLAGRYIRVAVRTHPENIKLINALKSIQEEIC